MPSIFLLFWHWMNNEKEDLCFGMGEDCVITIIIFLQVVSPLTSPLLPIEVGIYFTKLCLV